MTNQQKLTRSPLSLRILLALMLSLLAAVALVLAAIGLHQSLAYYQTADLIIERNQIAEYCLQAVKDFAFERGRTNIVLRNKEIISEKNRQFIDQRRSGADLAIAAALAKLPADFTAANSKIRHDWDAVKKLRLEVDRDVLRSLDERDRTLSGRWLTAANGLIENIEALLVTVSRVPGADSTFDRMSAVRVAALEFRNVVGTESGKLGAELSAGAIPTPAVIAEVHQLRGRSIQLWLQMERDAALLGDAGFTAALDQVRESFFGKLRPLQDEVLHSALSTEPLPVSLDRYTTVAIASLDSVINAVDSVGNATNAYAVKHHVEAQRHMLLDIVAIVATLLLLGLSLAVLTRRITGPLHAIVNRIQSLSDGGAVAITELRGDELAAVAGSLDLLEESLLARQRAAEALACSEQELATQRALLQEILDKSPVGTAFTTQGVFAYANPQFEKIFDARVGDRAENIYIKPEDRVEMLASIEREGVIHGREVRMKATGGEERDCLATFIPFVHDGKQGLMGWLLDITERKRAQNLLQESKDRLEAAASAGIVGIWDWDIATQRLVWDKVMCKLHGVSEDHAGDAHAAWIKVVHPDDLPRLNENMRAALRGDGDYIAEYRVIWSDGSVRHLKVVSRTNFDENGQPLRMIGVSYDLTEQKAVESQLMIMKTAIEQSPVSVVVTDTNTIIEYVNPCFHSLSGYTPDETIGKMPAMLQSGLTNPAVYQEMWAELLQGHAWTGELINRNKAGNIYVEETHIAPVKNEKGITTHYVAIKLDVTERKKYQEQLDHLAHYDVLTNLPNRALFFDRVEQSLALARREGRKLALLFLDLDKFKPINDTYGHAVGDQVLQEVARRISGCLRESDTVGRIGGDEFVVLLSNLQSAADAVNVGEKIRQALNQPLLIEDKTLFISSCIGVALYPEHGQVEADLSKNADIAMYHAKVTGRDRVVVFGPEISKKQ